MRLLLEYNTCCSPPWSESELRHKVQSAIATPSNKPRGWLLGNNCPLSVTRSPVARPRPAQRIDPATATENFLKGFRADLPDVWEASSIRPPCNWREDGVCLISWLYQPGELVNVVTDFKLDADGKAKPKGYGESLTREEWIDRLRQGSVESEAGAWIRMNPVDNEGISDANVTAFRFALLESDTLPEDLQLSLFTRLKLPVAAIVTSGGRSYHCWVKVDAPDAEEYKRIVVKLLSILEPLGIDAKNKNPSRLSRLPGAQRTNGAADDGAVDCERQPVCGRQRILYLNPNPPEDGRILE